MNFSCRASTPWDRSGQNGAEFRGLAIAVYADGIFFSENLRTDSVGRTLLPQTGKVLLNKCLLLSFIHESFQ